VNQCKECEQEFEASRWWQEFCSPKCRGAFHRRRYRQEEVEAHERPHRRVDLNGLGLGKPPVADIKL
jgi:hypothetical protein